MSTTIEYTDKDREPSAEMLASYPNLRIQFTEPVQSASLVPHLSPRFPTLLDSVATQVGNLKEIAPNIVNIVNLIEAIEAIKQKAQELGGLPGIPLSTITNVGDGYVRRYQGCDIYYSIQTGAHEVHGDIRAKYNYWQGAIGKLGLPITDERGTPDNKGQYNHFVGGSIYSSTTTGPMVVLNAVRNLWASQGWEKSEFGYPVSDTHVGVNADWIVINGAWERPPKSTQHWCKFQNGAIFSAESFEAAFDNRDAPALIAELTPDQLAQVVRNTLDKAFHAADDDIGIEGGGHVLHVIDWGYGFLASQPRLVTFEIHGFHEIPVLPDMTFRLELMLEFYLVESHPLETFKEPVEHTLMANLRRLRVDTSGIGNEALNKGLSAGIMDKFKQPLAIQTIPAAARLMDTLITMTGGLQFLLEPNVKVPMEANLRRYLFQVELNKLVSG
jgi:hypothetical protein